MEKAVLLSEISKTEKHVDRFLKDCPDEEYSKSTYADWNSKDILGHLAGWLRYSCKKLNDIKAGSPVEEILDFVSYNKKLYERNRDVPMQTMQADLNDAIDDYKKVIELYSADELERSDYPLGFSCKLWEYILLDGAVHPDKHFLYHYLKRGKYADFKSLLEATKAVFMLYSDTDIGVYDFCEFNDDENDIGDKFAALGRQFPQDRFIRQIVELNVKKE